MGKNAARAKRKTATQSRIKVMLKSTPGTAMDLPCPCRSGKLFRDCHGSRKRITHNKRCEAERQELQRRHQRRAELKRERQRRTQANARMLDERGQFKGWPQIIRKATLDRWNREGRRPSNAGRIAVSR